MCVLNQISTRKTADKFSLPLAIGCICYLICFFHSLRGALFILFIRGIRLGESSDRIIRHLSSISDIRARCTMADSRSCATICCSESNNHIRQYSSVRQIILGWNMFSAATWLLLLALFCIWCLTFFLIYTPEGDGMDGMDGMEH